MVFLFVAKKIESSDSDATAGNSLVVGSSFADFQYETLSQKKESFYDFKNKVIIVNFWASWCGPCLEEVPSLMALAEAHPQQIQLIAISADDARKDIDVFLKAFPHFTSENRSLTWDAKRSLRQLFRVSRFPETYIFDRNHVLRKHVVGAVDWRSSEVQNFVQGLF
jgi:thiol-disulfide isomerase/thioredoxin